MELFVFLIKFLGFSQIAYDRCHLPGREKAVAGTIAFLFEFLQGRKVVDNQTTYYLKATLRHTLGL